jgi:hypothetical protein
VGSSVKTAHTVSYLDHDLLGRTRKVWQPRFGRELTREDAQQIAVNVTGLFSVLAEWSRDERPTPAVDSVAPSVSEPTEARHER